MPDDTRCPCCLAALLGLLLALGLALALAEWSGARDLWDPPATEEVDE